MRYYVLARSQYSGVAPYILGEVVRESFDDGAYRDSSLASAFAGAGCLILTRDELLAEIDGAHTLLRWETGDEAAFDEETQRILAKREREETRVSRSHLRLVHAEPASDEAERSGDRTAAPPDAR